ncbi:MAG TPA: mandelate racemase/muconate lactonizing enzyme family protein [Jatrophihabitantaceae bacterium]
MPITLDTESSGTRERISRVQISLVNLPLRQPVNDAKVLTGRQKPLTQVAVLTARVTTADGGEGFGFSYSKRAGGPGLYAHAQEIAGNLIDEDPNDIGRLWHKLVWAGASVGRSGLATQAIAAFDIALWDLKARRAALPLAKLLGAYRDAVPCYNTSGGFLSLPIDAVLDNARAALARGVGGIKVKVGQPDVAEDLRRVHKVRDALGESVPLMIDANQQWDRATALRFGRAMEPLGLVWIEEPLDAYDVAGHTALASALDTPVASGEMLVSASEHARMIEAGAVDVAQPDAPRVGGITPFLRVMALADECHLSLAPHFAMEIHLHLAAAYPGPTWVEHFEWLEPLFNERIEIRHGDMVVPDRPGLGLSLSDQAGEWTVAQADVDQPG